MDVKSCGSMISHALIAAVDRKDQLIYLDLVCFRDSI
jgi:hypothetical protein